MIPKTGYEDSGETRNTTTYEETEFLKTISQNTKAQLELAGRTVLGAPIWCISIGTGNVVMVVANVHPREPAGRDAALMWFRDIAYSEELSVKAYLETHRIVLIPNVNVDGCNYPRWRNNANGVNINRDYIALREPESRAVAKMVQREKPTILMDMHQVSDDQGASWRPYWNAPPDANPSTLALGQAFVQETEDLIALDGHITLPYSSAQIPWAQLATVAVAWNCVGVLCEVAYMGIKNDVDLSRTILDNLYKFHADNSESLASARLDSEMDSRPDPIRIPTAVQIHSGAEVYVPSDGVYLINDDSPIELFDLHGIVQDGSVVDLNQPSKRLIAYLLDEQSVERIISLEVWAPSAEGGVTSPRTKANNLPRVSDGVYVYPVTKVYYADGNDLLEIKDALVSSDSVLRSMY